MRSRRSLEQTTFFTVSPYYAHYVNEQAEF